MAQRIRGLFKVLPWNLFTGAKDNSSLSHYSWIMSYAYRETYKQYEMDNLSFLIPIKNNRHFHRWNIFYIQFPAVD